MTNIQLDLKQIINLNQYPIHNEIFIRSCDNELDHIGVLTLPIFINNQTLLELVNVAEVIQFKAYYA